MANTDVNILLRVQDEASAKLKAVAGDMGGIISSVQRLAAGFGVTGAIAAGLTTVGVAATAMAARLSAEVEQLDNLSSATGVSKRNLQILQFAFEQGGVEVEALSKGLGFLEKSIANNDPALKKLGVTSRDTFNAFMEAAQGLQGISGSAERAKLIFDIFGKGGLQLTPVLARLATGFSDVAHAAESSGNVLSDSALSQMLELDSKFDKLSAAVKGMGKELAVAAAGPLVAFAEAMERIAEAGERQAQVTRTWEDFFLKMKAAGALMFSSHGPEGIHGPAEPDPFAKVRSNTQNFDQFTSSKVRGHGPDKKTLEIGPAVDKAREQLMTFSDLMEITSTKVMRAFDTIGQSLQHGLFTVFMGLTDRAQTFKSAFTTIFQSLVTGIQSAIGQLLASEAVRGLFKLLGMAVTAFGFPIVGAAIAAAGDRVAGARFTAGPAGGAPLSAMSPGPTIVPETIVASQVTARPVAEAPLSAMSPGPTIVNNYYQAISSKDLLQSMTSPHGSLRAANSRLFEIAGAS